MIFRKRDDRMEEEVRFPDTIVEIYDDEQIYNVLAITEFKPKNVVYIGTRKLKSKRIKNNIIACLRALGLETKCYFFSTDMLSIEAIIQEFHSIIEQFPDLVIDLTGGSEVALVAVGMIAKETGIGLMRYDRYEYRYRNIFNCPVAERLVSSPHFTVQSFLRLAGGEIKDHGHIALNSLDEPTAVDIFRVWEIFKRNYRDWHKLVSFLQQASKRPPDSNSLAVSSQTLIYSGDKLVGCDMSIMHELSDARIILNFEEQKGRVSFTYKSELMRSCLIDVGVCLELYVFATALRSDSFDDVRLSVVVDWDGDMTARINTVNEIDVMLVKGQVPVFISCKSGEPGVVALNEIKTLALKFGGGNGRAVLVTMADVKNEDPFLYQRASDMAVTMIDYNDLVSDRLLRKLITAARL